MEKFSLELENTKNRFELSEEKFGFNKVPAEKEIKAKSNNFYMSIRKNRFSRIREQSIGQIENDSAEFDHSLIDKSYLIDMGKLEGNFIPDFFVDNYLESKNFELQQYGLYIISNYLKSIKGKIDSLTQYLLSIVHSQKFLFIICSITSISGLESHKAIAARILNDSINIICQKQNLAMFESSTMIEKRKHFVAMICQFLDETKFIDSLTYVNSENVLEKQLHLLGLVVFIRNSYKLNIIENNLLLSKFENILESGFCNEIKNQVVWICNSCISIYDKNNIELSRLSKSIFEFVCNLNQKLRSLKSDLIPLFECKSDESVSLTIKNMKPADFENFSLTVTYLSSAVNYLYKFSAIDTDAFYEFFETRHAQALFNIALSINENSQLGALIERHTEILQGTLLPIICKKLKVSVLACLSIISNMLSGSNSNADELINFDVIYFYREILNECRNQVKIDWAYHEEVLMGISNIACGTLCQISHLSLLYDTILEIIQVLSSCSLQESRKVLAESLLIIILIAKSGLISKATYILNNEIISINNVLILAFEFFKNDKYYSQYLDKVIEATIRLINLDSDCNVHPKLEKSTFIIISGMIEEIQTLCLVQDVLIHKLQMVLES